MGRKSDNELKKNSNESHFNSLNRILFTLEGLKADWRAEEVQDEFTVGKIMGIDAGIRLIDLEMKYLDPEYWGNKE